MYDKENNCRGTCTCLNGQVFNCHLNLVIPAWLVMARGNLIHSVGAAAAKNMHHCVFNGSCRVNRNIVTLCEAARFSER